MTVNLQKILRPYQREDYQALLNDPLLINGSEMGTGKTEVAIAAMEAFNGKRNLIVCPSSMVLEWKERIERYIDTEVQVPFPYIDPKHSGYRLSKEHFQHQFLVVNYEMLRVPKVKRGRPKKKPYNPFNYTNVLKVVPWDTIWSDECHRYKNPDALQTKGIQQVVGEVKKLNSDIHIHGMSGTLFLNYPNELWTNLNLLHPTQFPNYLEFAKKYCYIQPSPWGPHIVGTRKSTLPELRRILQPLMVRREKKDVMTWLPDKSYRTIPVHMHGEQLRVYEDLEEELEAYLDTGQNIQAKNGLALTMRLRQWSLEPKLLDPSTKSPSVITSTLFDLLEDIVEAGQQVVVFSWFASYLRFLSDQLTKKKIPHGMIAGSAEGDIVEERKVRKEFQSGKTPIMLASITKMIGIDLDSAHIGIFTDRYWVPGINKQAEERLERGNNSNKVTIIDIVPQDSIYGDIRQTLQNKTEAFNETVALKRVAETFMSRRK